MNLIKYCGIQLMLFCVIILTGSYAKIYIKKPFGTIDITTIIIEILLLIITLNIADKLKAKLKPIHSINKILLSIVVIFIATFLTGVLIGEIKF